MHFSTLITLIYQVVTIATAVSSSRSFSRRASDYRKIRMFVGVSISRCERECGLRSRCQGVIYDRKIPGCILISDFRLDQSTANDTGTVLTTGFGASGLGICGSKTCSAIKSCVEDGNGHACKATECGPLPNFYTSVKGNMYTIASRLVIGRSSETFRITCSREGLWEVDNSSSNVSVDCTSVTGGSGVYTLSSYMLNAYCDMDADGGNWTVFQRRQDGYVDFLRGWDDYVRGFGNLDGEFWLGLRPLYQILHTGEFELRVDMEAFSGERRYANYKTFSMAGEADNYRLSVDGYSGDAGDSLRRQNGMMFTTIDRDNDISWYRNCAVAFRCGWWHELCHNSCLNGLYHHGGEYTGKFAIYITWRTWLGYYKSPKRTEMKIRRK